MRRFAIVVGVLGMLALATSAGAVPPIVAPAPPSPTPVPYPSLAPTVSVVDFVLPQKKAPPGPPIPNPAALTNALSGSYSGGPTQPEVVLKNTGTTVAKGIHVRLVHGGTVLEQTVDVPPAPNHIGSLQGPFTVVFTDPSGVPESCSPHDYTLTLSGPGAETHQHHARITPSCSLGAKIEDAWNQMTPDHVAAAKKGTAFVSNVAVEVQPACNTGMRLKATVTNQSAKAGSSLIVSARQGDTVKGQSIAFALPAGGSKDTTATAAAGTAEDLDVVLFDPTHILASAIASHSVKVKISRSCNLAATLDP